MYGTYFSGGMDRKTCKSVSERMNMPLEEVMYAPVGEVFITDGMISNWQVDSLTKNTCGKRRCRSKFYIL